MIAMVWVVVALIVILGAGLPAAGWWLTRKPWPAEAAGRGHGEIDRWLADQFGLGWRDRSRVQHAVVAGRPVGSPALEAAVRGLAAEVMAGRFRTLRVARAASWLQLITGPAYAVFGLVVLIGARQGGERAVGIFAILNGALMSWAGVYRTLRNQRIRRSAGQILQSGRNATSSSR